MNMSRVVSSLKMSLGLYSITLPFKDELTNKPIPVEKIIHDVLTTITIPVYSEFVPWVREYEESIDKLKVIDKEKGIYLLPPFLTITPIKFVLSVVTANVNTGYGYGNAFPVYGSIPQVAQGVINTQAFSMLNGEMREEPTFQYMGENKIRLYKYPRANLIFRVAAEHDPNGETIEDSCYDSFMELATYDMKIFLYNNLRMYDKIPTAFGEINLKLEDYQSAESDRKAMLDEWRDRFHLDLSLEQFF